MINPFILNKWFLVVGWWMRERFCTFATVGYSSIAVWEANWRGFVKQILEFSVVTALDDDKFRPFWNVKIVDVPFR